MARKLAGTVLTATAVLLATLALAQEGHEQPQMTAEQMAEKIASERVSLNSQHYKLWSVVVSQLFESLRQHYSRPGNRIIGNHYFTQTNADTHPGL